MHGFSETAIGLAKNWLKQAQTDCYSTTILRNIMYLKKKRNYHETIHDGAVGKKQTI